MRIYKHKELYCKKCNKLATHTFVQTDINEKRLYLCVICKAVQEYDVRRIETMLNLTVRLRE